jgi:hypothetical protein
LHPYFLWNRLYRFGDFFLSGLDDGIDIFQRFSDDGC